MRFARSAMNCWVNCIALPSMACPTWLQALRRISGRSSPSTAIAAVICTRGAIAASCDQDDLVRWGGHVGAFLFARSREAPPPASVASVFGTRRTITLATGPLRKMLPIDDEPDEEDCEPV